MSDFFFFIFTLVEETAINYFQMNKKFLSKSLLNVLTEFSDLSTCTQFGLLYNLGEASCQKKIK